LESDLNLRFPEKKWEIINTAVPGHNTVMKVETLKQKALAYGPDIVIIENTASVFDLPNFICESPESEPRDSLSITKSYFVDFLLGRLETLKRNYELFHAPHQKENPGLFESDPQKVPEKYKSMVGWNSYVNAMEELKKMQEENAFEVVIYIAHAPLAMSKKILDLAKQLKFYVLCDFQDFSKPSLLLSKKDAHPSELGHKIKAEAILKFLNDEGIIEKYLARFPNNSSTFP